MKKLIRRTAQPRAMRPVSAEYAGESVHYAKPELSTGKKIRNAVFKLGAVAGIGAALFVGVKERSTIIDKVSSAGSELVDALTPPTSDEIKKSYAENLRPAAVDIARRAVEFSERPNGVFTVSESDLSTSVTISASGSNKYGFTTGVEIEMGRTDGKPDPEKVTSIAMTQPQGGGFSDEIKTVFISAPSDNDSEAWSGHAEIGSGSELHSRSIAGTIDPSVADTYANESGYNYQGESAMVAQQADKVFTEIAKDLQLQAG